ncbi:hypothetical protein MA03_05655 [Infirmifilum uzonense]|uniref:DUF1925 domain-containing protein n=1 Tax=Infirmifilum uzonense TaxID=1550241 RepID=A0A0F7CL61_9CREN|nr:alpha-amylase/4-alpha-glucanotransferase domain-containing protein [Infirmifilum uzonense]AKG38851.1 hypothetical protein MA03_05655 [Infirmifilum uzonense]
MKSTFIFILHFHQPIGQLKSILRRIQSNSYEMLLDLFSYFKDLPLTLHFSGPLLLYWREYYPDYLERMKDIIQNSRFEVLGGAFSESILSILPYEDRVEQLKRGRKLVEDLLGVRPKGLWLAERVWDPTLPSAIKEAAYSYVIVDDEVGYRSGLWRDDTHTAILTEYAGRKIGVLFIDANIRYILPWRTHTEVLDYIRSFRTPNGFKYVLWGSDAEKFGEWWPRENAEPWLRLFFHLLRESNDIQTLTPSEYIKRYGFTGLAYLGPWSYDKMIEWSGGYFPNFLRKYPEANNMHKKLLRVREKLVRLKAPPHAWENYYLAQCNDAYWHGLFGGTYLPILRQAIYEHLIKAERISESSALYYASGLRISEEDFDYDGRSEILIESLYTNFYIKPSDGGSLFELDIKLEGYEHNLINTMSRYAEPYLSGITDYRPDWYRRVSFREHIWKRDASLRDWIENTPFVDVSDLALKHYLVEHIGDGGVVLSAMGRDWSIRSQPSRIHVTKVYEVEDEGKTLRVKYIWRNMEKRFIDPKISIELSLMPKLPWDEESTPNYTVDDAYSRSFTERFESPWSRTIRISSKDYKEIVVENNKHAEVWVAPIETLARTEKGLKKELQGIGITFNHIVALNPGESFETQVTLRWL